MRERNITRRDLTHRILEGTLNWPAIVARAEEVRGHVSAMVDRRGIPYGVPSYIRAKPPLGKVYDNGLEADP